MENRYQVPLWQQLGFAILVFLAALGITRLVVLHELAVPGNPFNDGRRRSAAHNMDEVLAEHADSNVVVVVGSSSIQRGFSPDAFDERLESHWNQPVSSFNYGFPALSSENQNYLCQSLVASGTKISVAVIEVNFNVLSARTAQLAAEEPAREEVVLRTRSLFQPPGSMLRQTFTDPELGMRLLSYRYLYDGLTPAALSRRIGKRYFGRPDWWPWGPEEQPPMPFDAVVEEAYGELWVRELRGGVPYDLLLSTPSTRGAMEFFKANIRPDFEADRAYMVHEYDAIEYNAFDEGRVSALVRTLKMMRKHADITLGVVSPEDREVMKREPAALARMQALLQRLRQESGVPIVDFGGHTGFTYDDFADANHLGPIGVPKYSQLLADEVARLSAIAPQP
jgi:hypothetical protein